jgi:hypothetical protein
MAGRNANFANFTVTVSGAHSGVNYTGNNVNALAPGDLLTVSVSGNYSFMNIIPLVSMPSFFTLSSSVTMFCEGGT